MIIICKKLIDLTPFLKIESDVTLNLNPEPDADEIALFRILVENTMMSEQTCFSRKYTRAARTVVTFLRPRGFPVFQIPSSPHGIGN